MTSIKDSPAGRPDPPANLGFQEGLYLEKKKGSIGTGDTAKTAEYRTFWATGRLSAGSAAMFLLDDEFKPTGLRGDLQPWRAKKISAPPAPPGPPSGGPTPAGRRAPELARQLVGGLRRPPCQPL